MQWITCPPPWQHVISPHKKTKSGENFLLYFSCLEGRLQHSSHVFKIRPSLPFYFLWYTQLFFYITFSLRLKLANTNCPFSYRKNSSFFSPPPTYWDFLIYARHEKADAKKIFKLEPFFLEKKGNGETFLFATAQVFPLFFKGREVFLDILCVCEF